MIDVTRIEEITAHAGIPITHWCKDNSTHLINFSQSHHILGICLGVFDDFSRRLQIEHQLALCGMLFGLKTCY